MPLRPCLARSQWFLASLLLLQCVAASAEDSTTPYVRASTAPPAGAAASAPELYASGKFSEALDAFLKVPPKTAAQHYNAGILALKAQQVGRAYAHLSMAESIAPGNAEISTLHESVYNQARTLFGAQRLNAWAGHPVSWFGHPYSSLVAALLGVGCLSLSGSLLLAARRGRRDDARSTGSAASFQKGALVALFLLLTLERAGSFWMSRNATPAVVLDSAIGRTGPGSSYLERARLEAGSRVLARPSALREGWILVRTPQETLAWIERDKVGLLFGEP